MPEPIRMFLKEFKPPKYWFPWGRCDIHVDRRFWMALSGLDTFKRGWLSDIVRKYIPVNFKRVLVVYLTLVFSLISLYSTLICGLTYYGVLDQKRLIGLL